MIETPILSIVIPTKNRYEYLKHLISLYISCKFKNVELIIQDNSDSNIEFKKVIADFQKIGKNIHYFYCNDNLSVVQNCDRAIKNSSGKYVLLLGDDDGFSSYIEEFVEWMYINKIESAITSTPKYQWPDIKTRLIDRSGTVSLTSFNNFAQKMFVQDEILFVLKRGGTVLGKLPKVYHGIVFKETLDRIYINCQTYFPGPSPDMANAVALSLMNINHYYIDIPLIISGQGFKSGAGMGARHAHKGDLKDFSHLPKDTEEKWDIRIPKIWTGQTIWAESVVQSLEQCKNKEFMHFFNFNYLYAAIYVFHKDVRFLLKNQEYSKYWLLIFIMQIWFLRFKNLIKNIILKLPIFNLIGNNKEGVLNIQEAISFIDGLIERHKSLDQLKALDIYKKR